LDVKYTVDVVETVAISRTYVVEADNEAQAREKAGIGDTLEEYDAEMYGNVVDRDVFDISEGS
jgi:hypothetical protein